MTSSEFKTGLKQIKRNLKGLTLQLRTKNSVTPFYSLKEFGNAILNEENKGMSFTISRVWTKSGVKFTRTFDELVKVLSTEEVSAIAFTSTYQPKDFADYLNKVFGTNE